MSSVPYATAPPVIRADASGAPIGAFAAGAAAWVSVTPSASIPAGPHYRLSLAHDLVYPSGSFVFVASGGVDPATGGVAYAPVQPASNADYLAMQLSLRSPVPPVAMTSTPVTVSGAHAWNGTYQATNSSGDASGWRAFDGSAATAWEGVAGAYNTTPSGGVRAYNPSGIAALAAGYSGEFLRLQLPARAQLVAYEVLPASGALAAAPASFRLYGRLQAAGGAFFQLDEQVGLASWTASGRTFEVMVGGGGVASAPEAYDEYALAVAATAGADTLRIAGVRLFARLPSRAALVAPSGHAPLACAYYPSGDAPAAGAARPAVLHTSHLAALAGANVSLGRWLLAQAACIAAGAPPASLTAVFPDASGHSTRLDAALAAAVKAALDSGAAHRALLQAANDAAPDAVDTTPGRAFAVDPVALGLTDYLSRDLELVTSLTVRLDYARFGQARSLTLAGVPLVLSLSRRAPPAAGATVRYSSAAQLAAQATADVLPAARTAVGGGASGVDAYFFRGTAAASGAAAPALPPLAAPYLLESPGGAAAVNHLHYAPGGALLLSGSYGAAFTIRNLDGTASSLSVAAPSQEAAILIRYDASGAAQMYMTVDTANLRDAGDCACADADGNMYFSASFRLPGTSFPGYSTPALRNGDGTASALTVTFPSYPYTRRLGCFIIKYSPSGVAQWIASAASYEPVNVPCMAAVTGVAGSGLYYSLNVTTSKTFGWMYMYSANNTLAYPGSKTSTATYWIPARLDLATGAHTWFVDGMASVLFDAAETFTVASQGFGLEASPDQGRLYWSGSYDNYQHGGGASWTLPGDGVSLTANPRTGLRTFLVAYDVAGATPARLWATFLGSAAGFNNAGFGLAVDASGGAVYVAGRYNGAVTVYNGYTAKLAASAPANAGVTLAAGDNTAFVLKYNASGVAQAAARVPGALDDIFKETRLSKNLLVRVGAGGDVLVAGTHAAPGKLAGNGNAATRLTLRTPAAGGTGVFLAAFAASGLVPRWAAHVGGAASPCTLGHLVVSPDGTGVLLAANAAAPATATVPTLVVAADGQAAAVTGSGAAARGLVARLTPFGTMAWPAPHALQPAADDDGRLVRLVYDPASVAPCQVDLVSRGAGATTGTLLLGAGAREAAVMSASGVWGVVSSLT
jgi:hypothetical protein